jgi:hypothetical protein
MMTEESPWLGGPKVTKAEFKEHLAARDNAETFVARKEYNFTAHDDVLEYLKDILDGPK